jgi:acyl-CoA thioester hydrolase
MPDSAVPPHLHALAVAPGDIDFMGHVNNSVYLTWVQEAVIAYWRRVAPAEAVAGHLWVALKHEITYRRPAFLEDNVVAQVVAEGMHGARAFFHTLIKRGEDVLAEVKSSWCCLDAATQRPARLARDVVRMFVGEKAAE